jgi:hypothetical protein
MPLPETFDFVEDAGWKLMTCSLVCAPDRDFALGKPHKQRAW